MQIDKHKHVTFEFTITTDDGSVVGSSEGGNPLSYVHGTNSIFPRLEEALGGKPVDEQLSVTLAPEETYGPRDDNRIIHVPREKFDAGEELSVGMMVVASGPQGDHPMHIIEMNDAQVTLDGNHPLAGQTLTFNVTIVAVRDATPEELAPQEQSSE